MVALGGAGRSPKSPMRSAHLRNSSEGPPHQLLLPSHTSSLRSFAWRNLGRQSPDAKRRQSRPAIGRVPDVHGVQHGGLAGATWSRFHNPQKTKKMLITLGSLVSMYMYTCTLLFVSPRFNPSSTCPQSCHVPTTYSRLSITAKRQDRTGQDNTLTQSRIETRACSSMQDARRLIHTGHLGFLRSRG